VFGPDTLLTAPKALTGECESASGAINLVTAALAVREGLVPATTNLTAPLPDADVRHVTTPLDGIAVRRAVATASTPGSLFASALLGPA
jgi:3-oxoacyl-[acyl-carrier-protein] synthase II